VLIRIEPLSQDPIFEQISFQVKGAVSRGELEAGDKLPSVRELARELSVNPNTVVRAYDGLERDGVIARRQGTGCFITGRTSALNGTARRKQLVQLLGRAVTEAYHLGFDADEVREALEKGLRQVRFPETRRRKE
jgi:GntR family transcriptional regulator